MQRPVAPVDWKKVESDVNEILEPRAKPRHRGQADTGLELWEIALGLEQWGDGAEGDKARARAYIRDVAGKAQEVQLPLCTRWMRFRGTPCFRPEK